MEVEVTQKELSKALGVVSRSAAGARTTLPILSNILIRAEKNKVSLTATDLDMAVVEYVPVISAKDGAITVPARLITEFIGNLPRNEKIQIKVEGIKVKISAGRYTSTINGVQADDFPELPEIEEKTAVKFVIGSDAFKAGVSEVVVATSNDMSRPSLTGTFFSTDAGKLYIAATDGYRMAEKEFISKVSSDVKAIVPTPSLQEAVRSLPEDVEEVEIVFDETQVRFRMGEIEITSKLINGTLPNYRSLIPGEMDVEILLDRDEVIRMTKMASAFSRESDQTVICETDAEKGVFAVSSVANEMGENRSEIEAKVEKSVKTKVDSRYLMRALNSLEEPVARIGISSINGQMLLRNEKSNLYRHTVMPLSL